MKICFISRFYKPHVRGGAEIYVGRIAENLVERGHEVIVITPAPGKENYIDHINNVRVYRIFPFNLSTAYDARELTLFRKLIYHLLDTFNLDAYIKIKNILKKERPDLVHINNYKGLSASVFKAVKDLKIPLVFTAHDFCPVCVRTNLLNSKGNICKNPRFICKIYKRLQKASINGKPDLCTAPSQFLIDELRANGFFNDNMLLLRNPVESLSKRIKKTYDKIDFLYVGALSKHKGTDVLIRAFRELENDNIRLHIVGRGPDENKLKALHGDDERIIFHGFLEGEELSGMYGKANVTVVPSIWYENSPMVLYESFAHSTPVIGSNIGGIPELVSEGYNGFLFEPGDKDELKGILKRLVEDPSILKEFGKNAYESAKKYTLNEHVDKLEGIYRGLLVDV